MHSLSTAYPQLFDGFTIALVLYAIVAPIGLLFYVRKLYDADFPGKRLINSLRTDVAEFQGMIADLTERFTRFQNKEGMRAARDAKEREKTILEQAQEIAANASSPEEAHDKAALYRQRRSRMQ